MIEDCVMTTLSPPAPPSLPATIVFIAGDGVGQEVIPAAAAVLAALGLGLKFVEAPAGPRAFC